MAQPRVSRRLASIVLASLVLAGALPGCAPPAAVLERDRAFQRGVALGLFGGDLDQTRQALDEIATLGSSDVSIVVTWVQDDLRASEVRRDSRYTPDERTIRATIRLARARGLRVTMFPMIRLIHRTAAEWRGLLRPSDPGRWFASYRAEITALAQLSAEEGVARICVGSELASLEDSAEWPALIAGVRARFTGQLLYSANWDRYDKVPFWKELDLIGVSAYWGVTAPDQRPTIEEALASWSRIRTRLRSFVARERKPLVLTEVGYPAVQGGGAWPWNDFLTGWDGIEDAEAQRRLYEAFTLAWGDAPELAGVYFWFWILPGGVGDRGYSPRHKPAEWVVRHWFKPRVAMP